MDLFHSDDFHDSIDDMCDDALRRMHAFREGGLHLMQEGDAYYSEILRRDSVLDVVEFDTITRTTILDRVHENIIQENVPDYLLGILGGAAIVLARHAAFLGRGSDVIVPNQELAREKISETLLFGKRMLENKDKLRLMNYELGSLGATSLVLGPDDEGWTLYYESHLRVNLVRF